MVSQSQLALAQLSVEGQAETRDPLASVAREPLATDYTSFIAKMSERLRFERCCAELYRGMIRKLDALGGFPGGPLRGELVRAAEHEREHGLLVAGQLRALGAGARARDGEQGRLSVGNGLAAVVGDSRTSLMQSLSAGLAAELIDCEAWEALVDMARQLGEPRVAERFSTVLDEKRIHLGNVRRWIAAGERRRKR